MSVLLSLVEALFGIYFGRKPKTFAITLSLLVVGIGQWSRCLAMYHCNESFSHIIREQKGSQKLITSGIYSYFRHPSYFGFYVWTIGTQLLLQNWICLFLFIVSLQYFFVERIEYEEKLLVEFYGKDYIEYRSKVYSGIPFVK